MYIAQKLRKENIGEYLLYMWQIEDLIRAFQFDIEQIDKTIVQPYQLPIADKKKLYQWYKNLIEMMKTEQIKKSGHLQVNQNIVEKLNDYHEQLYHATDNAATTTYQATFLSIQPLLTALRKQMPNQERMNDIEVCFSFLYGILLLNMKKTDISTETKNAQRQITQFVQLLTQVFMQNEQKDSTI